MTLRAAILGCGRIAGLFDRPGKTGEVRTHASAYWAHEDTKLVAVADPDRVRAREFSRRWGRPSVYADARELLAAETPDLGHSILTYTLLAGMNAVDRGPLAGQKVGVMNGDRMVDVLGWFRYAKDHVPALYEKYTGRQQSIEMSGEDQPTFPLLRLEK